MTTLPDRVQNLLKESETVQWSASRDMRPKKARYAFHAVFFYIFAAMLILSLAAAFRQMLLGYGILATVILLHIRATIYRHRSTDSAYVATDERVITYSDGLFGSSSMESIDWDDVTSVEVETDFISNLSDTGSVSLEGYTVPDIELDDVSNPYDALNQLDNAE